MNKTEEIKEIKNTKNNKCNVLENTQSYRSPKKIKVCKKTETMDNIREIIIGLELINYIRNIKK